MTRNQANKLQKKTAVGNPSLEVSELMADGLSGVSIAVSPGELVGIAGLTGSGRDSLLGAIFGASVRNDGAVSVSGSLLPPGRPDLALNAGLAYMPEDRKLHGGVMSLSARENLVLSDLSRYWRRWGLSRRAEMEDTQSWFGRLDVRANGGIEALMSTLSGGNQQKVLFGKWLRSNPVVFLLDEPTHGVDVGAKQALHSRLLAAASEGMAIVVSSTDVDELASLCQRVIVLENGKIADEITGEDLSGQWIAQRLLEGQTAPGEKVSNGES